MKYSLANLEVFAVVLTDKLVFFRRLVEIDVRTYIHNIYTFLENGIRLGHSP